MRGQLPTFALLRRSELFQLPLDPCHAVLDGIITSKSQIRPRANKNCMLRMESGNTRAHAEETHGLTCSCFLFSVIHGADVGTSAARCPAAPLARPVFGVAELPAGLAGLTAFGLSGAPGSLSGLCPVTTNKNVNFQPANSCMGTCNAGRATARFQIDLVLMLQVPKWLLDFRWRLPSTMTGGGTPGSTGCSV